MGWKKVISLAEIVPGSLIKEYHEHAYMDFTIWFCGSVKLIAGGRLVIDYINDGKIGKVEVDIASLQKGINANQVYIWNQKL